MSAATAEPELEPSVAAPAAPPAAAPKTAPLQGNVQTCAECRVTTAWGSTSWCPQCGFHPRLNRKVDVDQETASESDDDPRNIWELLPPWSKALGGVCLLSLAEVVAANVLLADSAWRLPAGAAHILLGLAAAGTGHALAYFFGAATTDKMGPLDAFVNPVAIWRPALLALPETQRMLQVACVGLIVWLGGMAMIGRDFGRIFEVDNKPKKKLVVANPGASLAKNAQGEEVESIDEAVTQFAGEGSQAAGLAAGAANGLAPGAEAEEVRPYTTLECVVFGYLPDEEGRIKTLLLAAREADGPWTYAGPLETVGIPLSERQTLARQLRERPIRRPAVRCSVEGVWVRPDIACLVEHRDREADGSLKAARWKSLAAK
ncbi:MAG: hypothetical protein KF774_17580 [Planctomyces sp.]|nr:hypothetical protein [Planctomyces sp.]